MSCQLSIAVLPMKPRARHNVKDDVKLKIHLIRSILFSVILRRSNPSRSLVIRHTTHQHIHLFFFFLQLRWVVGSPICLKNEMEREEKRNKVCKEKSPFRVRSCIKASTYRWSIARGVSKSPAREQKKNKKSNQWGGLIVVQLSKYSIGVQEKLDCSDWIPIIWLIRWKFEVSWSNKTDLKHWDLLRKLKHEAWNTVSSSFGHYGSLAISCSTISSPLLMNPQSLSQLVKIPFHPGFCALSWSES